MSHYLNVFLIEIAGLLPILNPLAAAVIFVSITAGMSVEKRKREALLSCIYSFAILIAFHFAGQLIIGLFGISIAGVRIGGGLIILASGYKMLFPDQLNLPPDLEDEARDSKSVAFTPMAMPTLAGPGAISVVLSSTSELHQAHPIHSIVVITLGVLVCIFACYLVLRMADRLIRMIGANGVDGLSKIMGFILITIAIEFIHSGVVDFAKRV